MNFAGRCKSFIMAISLISCSNGGNGTSGVSKEEYSLDRCWRDSVTDKFAAFLVLSDNGDYSTPYVISARCEVSGEYQSYGEFVLRHLEDVNFMNSARVLENSLNVSRIRDNEASDQMTPDSQSVVYYISADASRATTSSDTYYQLRHVLSVQRTGLSFRSFLSLSQEDRRSLVARLTSTRSR